MNSCRISRGHGRSLPSVSSLALLVVALFASCCSPVPQGDTLPHRHEVSPAVLSRRLDRIGARSPASVTLLLLAALAQLLLLALALEQQGAPLDPRRKLHKQPVVACDLECFLRDCLQVQPG